MKAHYSDPEQRDRLRFRLMEDKTIDLLLDKSVPAPKSEKKEDGEE